MTVTLYTIGAVAWMAGCMVGIGIGGYIERQKRKNELQRQFVERNKRVG